MNSFSLFQHEGIKYRVNVQTEAVAQTQKRILAANVEWKLKCKSNAFIVITILWDLFKSGRLIHMGYF